MKIHKAYQFRLYPTKEITNDYNASIKYKTSTGATLGVNVCNVLKYSRKN